MIVHVLKMLMLSFPSIITWSLTLLKFQQLNLFYNNNNNNNTGLDKERVHQVKCH